MDDKKIKILVGYHKPATLLKSDIFVPIHLGRALTTEASKDGEMSPEDYQWMFDNMIGDDSGDNISNLNRRLCETTALYWAWKNYDKLGNPEYIGFMHYRRFLSFSEKPSLQNQYGTIDYPRINKKFIDETELNSARIQEVVTKYDLVTVNPWAVCGSGANDIYDQFEKTDVLDIKDYDIALNILKTKYPEFEKAANIYNKSPIGYFTNIFIMKKELFFEYSTWLFDILLEAEERIQKYTNIEKNRVVAHISERLFGIYLTYLKLTNKKLKIKECQRTFLINTDVVKEIKPTFENEIPIIMSSDNNYVQYLAVCIKSLFESSSPEHNYCIYVLHTDINEVTKDKIKKLETNNCKVKFVNVSEYLEEYSNNLFYIINHVSIATYYRFFIPQIFKNFKKVIYCDCDAVILDDIANLFNTVIGNKWLGAVRDTWINYLLSKSKKNEKYFTNYLGMKNPKNYFQAGVLIMNIQELRNADFTNLCIKTLKHIHKPQYVDQDILNIVCNGKVQYIHEEWNVLIGIYNFIYDYKLYLDTDIQERYEKAIQNPKYIHYCGHLKPWQLPQLKNSEYFWKFAKMTDFYEQILFENAQYYKTNLRKWTPDNKLKLSFPEKIFSIKNLQENNNSVKRKIITILGIKIKIKLKRRKKHSRLGV